MLRFKLFQSATANLLKIAEPVTPENKRKNLTDKIVQLRTLL